MTNQLLAGIHDREGAHIVPPGGWCLDTIALSENPPPTHYAALAPGINWLARINWGYGSTGTLPVPEQYSLYVNRLADYVANSSGCSRWIIGNEPNLRREWPQGQPILPHQYADCYKRARAAIHALPGHEHDEVLIAAAGPWNNELKYAGNPDGDWIKNFKDVIEACGDEFDGFTFHSYTHGYLIPLVTSSARMQPPFQHRHYEFLTYRDFMEAIGPKHRLKSAYLTEANGNGPWQAVGLIPAMLNEIDGWNRSGAHPISALIFYRYPRYDQDIQFGMEGNTDVVAEFTAACARGHSRPDIVRLPYVVAPVAPAPASPSPALKWDARLDLPKGMPRARLVKAAPQPGQEVWDLVELKWLDEQESQGKHHVFVDVVDEQGNRMVGIPVIWSRDGHEETKKTELKPGHDYALDFPMFHAKPTYSVRIGRGASDGVEGVGMGDLERPDWNIHTSYKAKFQRRAESVTIVESAPQPPPAASLDGLPTLIHPIHPSHRRVISQGFGGNAAFYSRFTYDGVPLQGHNGLDFDVDRNTPILAVDNGVVRKAENEIEGFGNHVLVIHSWGESLYAHLDRMDVAVGQYVERGSQVGLSGSTGASSAPHLHFGLRVNPYSRTDGWGGFVDPAPYLLELAGVSTLLLDRNDWNRAWPIVLDIEGRDTISTDRNDPGNYRPDGTLVGSKYGISALSHPTVDIVNLTMQGALAIFYHKYWLNGGCNLLPWPLCLLHFDAFVQNEVAAREFLAESNGNPALYLAKRIEWYTEVNTWDHHGVGWMRRCATMLRELAKSN